MKNLSIEEKTEFFQFLVVHADDLSKIAFVWLSCSNKKYIRPKLEDAFSEDFEDWLNSFNKSK